MKTISTTINDNQFIINASLFADYNHLVDGIILNDRMHLDSNMLSIALSSFLPNNSSAETQSTDSRESDYSRSNIQEFDNKSNEEKAKQIAKKLPSSQEKIFFSDKLCMVKFFEENNFILEVSEELYTGIIFELNETNKFLLKCINLHDQIFEKCDSGCVMLYAACDDHNADRSIYLANFDYEFKAENNIETRDAIKEAIRQNTDSILLDLSKVNPQVNIAQSNVQVSKQVMPKTYYKKIACFGILTFASLLASYAVDAAKSEILNFFYKQRWSVKQDLIDIVTIVLMILAAIFLFIAVVYASKQYCLQSEVLIGRVQNSSLDNYSNYAGVSSSSTINHPI